MSFSPLNNWRASDKNQNWFILIYGVLLFCYVGFRSFNLSFTYDEVVSFTEMKIVKWNTTGLDANRHYINSILMNFFSKHLGESEFFLRLGSTISFVIYYLAAVRITTNFQSNVKIHLLLALTAVPFLLDFFSLARGYGISLSLMLLSLSFLLAFIQKNTSSKLFFTLLFASISVLSNFTFLNFYLPLFPTLIVVIFYNTTSRKEKIKKLLFLLSLFIAFMALILPILFQLKETDNLYFGGRENFLTDTLYSLCKSLSYHQEYGIIPQIIFAILFLFTLFTSFRKVYKKILNQAIDGDIYLPILLIFSILSPIVQHFIFDTNYVVERTAIFYYPIFIIVLFQELKNWNNSMIKKINYGFTSLLLIHLLFSINFTNTYSWRYDSGTKQVLIDLQKLTNDEPIILGVDHFRTSSMQFYKDKLKYEHLWVSNVTLGTWNYPLNLEELNPYYYGQKEKEITDNSINVKDIISPEIHYYYLDNNLLHLLRLKNVKFRVITEYKYARATLIKISKPNSIIK